MSPLAEQFKTELSRRIFVLDGAMGTMLQKGFTPEQVLSKYASAGADIISANSFNANRIVQNANGLGDKAAQMAFDAVQQACEVALKMSSLLGRKIYVSAGASPTGVSLTMPCDSPDPALRTVDFDAMKDAYREEFEAFTKAGADIITLETCFDALNAKAAISALYEIDNKLPVIISATVADKSGRLLTGQSVEAFYRSVCHCPNLVAFGLNCALGARDMAPMIRDIASFSSHAVIFYPNAGLPDECGNYCDTPCDTASIIEELARDGMLNIAGGCCGTTPEHIEHIAAAVRDHKPYVPHEDFFLHVSGLDAVRISKLDNFTLVGERTNVAGSRKFAKLIEQDDFSGALEVGASQVEAGARIIDVNMDDPMVDSRLKMRSFLRHAGADPSVAKAAVMIDSSHFETIVEGLKNAQGKCIVNSISLKEGEEEFIRKASIIKTFGAAVIVMCFDENGQAETYSRKIEIAERSYSLLTLKAGFNPSDIIFDCNVLSIGTGIDSHRRFAIDFIYAVRWIKSNLPGALTSGGISNLSFAFRGNNAVRGAMHSVFLYRSIKAGLDMAIVNPEMTVPYDEIDPGLKKAVYDLIVDSDEGACARLLEMASALSEKATEKEPAKEQSVTLYNASQRLEKALITGHSSNVAGDALEALADIGSAVGVIEGPLMGGMARVGELFADGKMFLPQVVKAARIMKECVAALQPYIDADKASGGGSLPRFVIATVEGDVHDIGKNITATVLSCSGFEVYDLGVMVPLSTILDTAREKKADIIGVSGLITPSLSKMEDLCREMSRRGLATPLLVGGAAASAVHTAVKLAPIYPYVFYGSDASSTCVMAGKIISDYEAFKKEEFSKRETLASLVKTNPEKRTTEAIYHNQILEAEPFEDIHLKEIQGGEILDFLDWRLFDNICSFGQRQDSLRAQATALINDKLSVIVSARFSLFRKDGDSITSPLVTLPMLRGTNGYCLADYFDKDKSSQAGLVALRVKSRDTDGADPTILHCSSIMLAEAASQYLQKSWKNSLPEGFSLIVPAIGYSCCPDHSLKRDILEKLDDIGISLTESCAMIPEASICALVIAGSNVKYGNIPQISSEEAASYAAERHFTEQEKRLFLGHLVKS